MSLRQVREHVEDALARGATALVGGAPAELSDEDCSGGNFFQPTVLRDATPEMRCYREETFGPVAPLFRFAEEADAVAMANDTEYGLAAYAYTRDVGRSWRVAEALEYGLVSLCYPQAAFVLLVVSPPTSIATGAVVIISANNRLVQ